MRRTIGRIALGAGVAAAALSTALPAAAAPASAPSETDHVQLVALDGLGDWLGTPWTAVVDASGTVEQFPDESSARAAAATFESRTVASGFELWAEDGSTCLTVGTTSGNRSGFVVGRDAADCTTTGAGVFRTAPGDQLVAASPAGPALTVGTPTWSGSAVVLSAEHEQVVPFRFVGLGDR